MLAMGLHPVLNFCDKKNLAGQYFGYFLGREDIKAGWNAYCLYRENNN